MDDFSSPSTKMEMFWGHVCYRNDYMAFSLYYYRPSLGANILFLSIFATLIQPQLFLGIKHRNILPSIVITLGITTEILGYITRVLLTFDTFSYTFNMMNDILFTLAPTFIAAGVYFCFARVMRVFNGDQAGGKWFTWLFAGWTVLTLVLSSVAAGLQTWALEQTLAMTGLDLMTAGLSAQLFSIVLFVAISSFLALRWRSQHSKGTLSITHASTYQSTKFKVSIYAIIIATITLLIRTAWSIIDHVSSFSSMWKRREVIFMLLDGLMMIIACVALTLAHPGLGLGESKKADADGEVASGNGEGSIESKREESIVGAKQV